MFAIIKTGGKQYKVAVGDVIVVEKLEVAPSTSHVFDSVLMVSSSDGIKIGAPTVEGSQVKAEVLDQIRGEKIIVFKKKRRHNYRRKNGHRQWLTKLKIAEIVA